MGANHTSRTTAAGRLRVLDGGAWATESDQQTDPRGNALSEILARHPQALQSRYLETLTVIAADKNSTIVFPLPLDIIGPLLQAVNRSNEVRG